MNAKRLIPAMVGLVLAFPPSANCAAASDADPGKAEQQAEIKALKSELLRTTRDFEQRIHKLEAEAKAQPAAHPKAESKEEAAFAAAAVEAPVRAYGQGVSLETAASQPAPAEISSPNVFGAFEPGRGFVLARTKYGEVDMGLVAYLRYLNQTQLNHSYTDSFGRKFSLDPRQDIQWNKVNLSFKGWLFDPNFTYRVWIWTQQPAQGEGAQVVVGGHVGYHFSDYFNLFAGIAPLPSTRSTNWTYPAWLKMDNRTIADDFFRASYTQGVWADGKIADGLEYRAMIANNLSALGVSASQLDSQLNTLSGEIWWMPTTGEFGPLTGFGDYEGHEKLATLFALHFTRSREDKQSQPGVNDIENSQIRLSDGTLLFSPNAFNTGGQVNRATYQMADLEAGAKYLGWSLEAEYYFRWINDFQTTGFIPVTSLFDHGFQVQASAMVIPKQLQAYVAGSEVFGQYGNPWDFTAGLNWYPFWRREMHINAEAIYLSHSPVGGSSFPYIVGGNGWVFNTDVIVSF